MSCITPVLQRLKGVTYTSAVLQWFHLFYYTNSKVQYFVFYAIIIFQCCSWRSIKCALHPVYFSAPKQGKIYKYILKLSVIKNNWPTYQRQVNILFSFHKMKSFISTLWRCEDELLIQRCHKAHSGVCMCVICDAVWTVTSWPPLLFLKQHTSVSIFHFLPSWHSLKDISYLYIYFFLFY